MVGGNCTLVRRRATFKRLKSFEELKRNQNESIGQNGGYEVCLSFCVPLLQAFQKTRQDDLRVVFLGIGISSSLHVYEVSVDFHIL